MATKHHNKTANFVFPSKKISEDHLKEAAVELFWNVTKEEESTGCAWVNLLTNIKIAEQNKNNSKYKKLILRKAIVLDTKLTPKKNLWFFLSLSCKRGKWIELCNYHITWTFLSLQERNRKVSWSGCEVSWLGFSSVRETHSRKNLRFFLPLSFKRGVPIEVYWIFISITSWTFLSLQERNRKVSFERLCEK